MKMADPEDAFLGVSLFALSPRCRQHIQVNHRPLHHQRRPHVPVEFRSKFLPISHRSCFRPDRRRWLAQ